MSQLIEELPNQTDQIQAKSSLIKEKIVAEDENSQSIQKNDILKEGEPYTNQVNFQPLQINKKPKIQQVKNVESQQNNIKQSRVENPVDQTFHVQTQNQEQQKNVQVQTQKQKYRLHSEFFQSIQQQKERKVVEFDQFPQIVQQNAVKSEILPQKVNYEPVEKQFQPSQNNKQMDFSFSQSKQIITCKKDEINPKKAIDASSPPLKQESSKKIIGKISKKIIHQKKIHEVIVNLQKNDHKRIVIPRLQQTKKLNQKPDFKKLQTNITFNSNIISLTIGQLISKEDNEAIRLLDEIQQLKKKLFSMEQSIKRQEQQNQEDIQQNISKYQSIQQQQALTNKHNKRQNLGQFYRRVQFNKSKLSQQLQLAGLTARRGSSKSETVRSAPKPRFSSFQEGYYGSNSDYKDNNMQDKTGIISFRVKKNKMAFVEQHNANETKQAGFIKVKQKSLEKDQCFQTKKQAHPKLEFSQDEIMSLIEKPSRRQLTFNQNFRQHIQKHFFYLGDDVPKRNSSQQQLVQMAKSTFKKFGVNLQTEKPTLHIKKYKNCVSFILDSSRTILWYYQGKFYYGGWQIKEGDGQKNGWGYEYSPKKFMYSGFFKENKRDGYGIIKFLTKEDDAIYQGYWKDGFKNGKGKQRQIDGSIYIGQWLNGKKNGQGILKISQNQIYEGTFQNGLKSGQGKETFQSRDTFVGTYKQGKFHGLGTYTWANFSRYEGQFRNGSRNGQGIWVSDYCSQKNDSYEGQYKHDKKNGFGIYRWKDGTIYEGEFLNDLKHGQGVVTYGDGKSARLQWFQGNIILQQTSIEPQGSARNGKKQTFQSQKQKKSTTKPALVKFNIKNNSKTKAIKPI